MSFLSEFEDFLFEGFEFHKKKRQREWDEKYKNCPTGTEIAEKYNAISEPERLSSGSWLNFVGDNNDIKFGSF